MKSGYSLASGGDRSTDPISFDFIKIRCRAVSRIAINYCGAWASSGYEEGVAKTMGGTVPFTLLRRYLIFRLLRQVPDYACRMAAM